MEVKVGPGARATGCGTARPVVWEGMAGATPRPLLSRSPRPLVAADHPQALDQEHPDGAEIAVEAVPVADDLDPVHGRVLGELGIEHLGVEPRGGARPFRAIELEEQVDAQASGLRGSFGVRLRRTPRRVRVCLMFASPFWG
jgi:hypothetical protein